MEHRASGIVGIKGQAIGMAKAKRTQIVHAKDVVGMGVGVEDGVDVPDAFTEGLAAEVLSRVDDDYVRIPLNGDGWTAARIARVR